MINATELLSKKARLAIVCTGAGAGVQNELWKIPGISSILVDSCFPYANEFTDQYLGFVPENNKYCTEDVAVQLAMQAYYRAYKPEGDPAIGIGLTASVASVRAHRGDHRVFIAIVSEKGCKLTSVKLSKGCGEEDRKTDGLICDYFVIKALLENLDIKPGKFPTKEQCILEAETIDATEIAEKLLFKNPFFGKNNERCKEIPYTYCGIFPGSFNPPHEGHFGIESQYSRLKNNPVVFCIEQESPHKGNLSVIELLNRAKVLQGHDVLFTKGLPLYLDKAKAFNWMPILIGVDSLIRLLDPKWGIEPNELLNQFSDCNITFFVFDREVDGSVLSLLDVDIPKDNRFNPLNFRRLPGLWNVSSTQIRNQMPI